MIRVTVEDTETGEKDVAEMEDNYIVVTAGRHYVAHTQYYRSTGTIQVTIKKDG